ncbi:DUF6227 family protein [Streptomyces sp. NPDC000878]
MTHNPGSDRPVSRSTSIPAVLRQAEAELAVNNTDLAQRRQQLLDWMAEEVEAAPDSGSDSSAPAMLVPDPATGEERRLALSEAAEVMGLSQTAAGSLTTRQYVPDDSADHARRVLRRAKNEDRPGQETHRLLQTALAHNITQCLIRRYRIDGRDAGGTAMYEHAFLLIDGSEVSLWEVERTAAPDGSYVCEVYESEDAARKAMERQVQVR